MARPHRQRPHRAVDNNSNSGTLGGVHTTLQEKSITERDVGAAPDDATDARGTFGSSTTLFHSPVLRRWLLRSSDWTRQITDAGRTWSLDDVAVQFLELRPTRKCVSRQKGSFTNYEKRILTVEPRKGLSIWKGGTFPRDARTHDLTTITHPRRCFRNQKKGMMSRDLRPSLHSDSNNLPIKSFIGSPKKKKKRSNKAMTSS